MSPEAETSSYSPGERGSQTRPGVGTAAAPAAPAGAHDPQGLDRARHCRSLRVLRLLSNYLPRPHGSDRSHLGDREPNGSYGVPLWQRCRRRRARVHHRQGSSPLDSRFRGHMRCWRGGCEDPGRRAGRQPRPVDECAREVGGRKQRRIDGAAHCLGFEGIMARSAACDGVTLSVPFDVLRGDSEIRPVDSTMWDAGEDLPDEAWMVGILGGGFQSV